MATVIEARTQHEAVVGALGVLLSEGQLIDPDYSESNLGNYRYLEVQNVIIRIADPRARGVASERFDEGKAALRALWILSGSDRVDELAPLFPSVKAFADDGEHLSGSAIGARLLADAVSPGETQISGVLSRLLKSHNTRRASVAIFQPEDSLRTSVDIPCLLSLSWHVRGGKLVCTSVMRANNALRLLPFNLYEYSLLTECLAAELGIEPGAAHHHVISLHVYEPDFAILGTARTDLASTPPPDPMPAMHAQPGALASGRSAHDYVRKFRTAAQHNKVDECRSLELAAASNLDPYWYHLFKIAADAYARALRGSELDA